MLRNIRKEYQNVLKTFDYPSSLENNIYEFCKRLSNNESEELEEIYTKVAYEKIGEILENKDKVNDIMKDLKDDTTGWNSIIYKPYMDDVLKENSEQVEGVKVQKGAFRCKNRKCGSDETYYYQSQTRSADEGSTTHVVCSKCGNRYTFC